MSGSNLHNFIPKYIAPQSIGILGGKGAMGGLVAREFERDGYTVYCSGEDTDSPMAGKILQRYNFSIFRECDVVVFALPVEAMHAGIEGILGTGSFTKGNRGKLLMDICSLKVEPMAQMRRVKGASVIGSHPMFGPAVTSFQGQNVYLTPATHGQYVLDARTAKWQAWLTDFWQQRGATVTVGSPEFHDQQLAPKLQFLPLLETILYATMLTDDSTDYGMLERLATPNSRLFHALTGRMIRPELAGVYTNIALQNPINRDVIDQLYTHLHTLRDLIHTADPAAFHRHFTELASRLPRSYADAGKAQSVHLQQASITRHDHTAPST